MERKRTQSRAKSKITREKFNKFMNTSMTVKFRDKKASLRPAKLFSVLIIGALAIVLLYRLLMIPLHQPKTLDMNLETGGVYSIQPYRNIVLMNNRQNIKVLDNDGDTVWSTSHPMSSPVVEIRGDYIVAFDLDGKNSMALYKKGEKVRDINVEKDIISAKVNKKGMVAYATSADGYKGKVTVIDKKGNEIFSLSSSDGYIMDLDINENGHYLAVAQLLSSEEQVSSRIQFIDLYQKKVIKTADREGTIIGEVKFKGNKLITVSDSEFCGFSGSGRFQFSVSFAGKRAGLYDISGDEYLAFMTKDTRGNEVLEIYNHRGRLKGKYQADSHITSVAVHKDMIVISSQREVMRISPRGKLKKRVSCKQDIQSLGVFGNGKNVLTAGSEEAKILWMK